MRAHVYIDGFNLYYGALRGTPYKWLNLSQLAMRLLPKDQVARIRYFTARVSARANDPGQPQRQDTYLRALRTIPKLTIHFGRFQVNPVRMPLARPGRRKKMAEVIKVEEKGSDVNLASWILNPHPARYRSRDLQPNFFKQLRHSILKDCQFPSAMRDAAGKFFKPTSW